MEFASGISRKIYIANMPELFNINVIINLSANLLDFSLNLLKILFTMFACLVIEMKRMNVSKKFSKSPKVHNESRIKYTRQKVYREKSRKKNNN